MIGILILSSFIMGFLGRYVANEKNRSKAEGFWLGFLFSLLGVIIVALLPTKEKPKEVLISDEEKGEWDRVIARFHRICSLAEKKNIMVLVDAEESWIQPAIDDLVLKMMKIFNKKKVIVFNTLQAYRKDRFDYLLKTHEKLKQQNIFCGIKLVRGAYMEKKELEL